MLLEVGKANLRERAAALDIREGAEPVGLVSRGASLEAIAVI
jgi:hypothetical protein